MPGPSARADERGVVPVVGVVLLVAVVVVLNVVVIVPVLGLAEQTADPAPTVAFETAQTNDSITLTPLAGERVRLSQVAVRNETTVRPASAYTNASTLSAGVDLTVDDSLLDGDHLQVVYRADGESYVLRTVDIATLDSMNQLQPFDTPAYGKAQYDQLTSTDLAAGDPSTGGEDSIFGVQLTAADNGTALDSPTTVEVEVTDHLGTDPFDDAPNDRLIGSTTVAFDDGVGSFTIGGANRDDADLTLGFLGFLPSVNDVETIRLELTDSDATISQRVIDLTPEE